jgi:hypothetical protein
MPSSTSRRGHFSTDGNTFFTCTLVTTSYHFLQLFRTFLLSLEIGEATYCQILGYFRTFKLYELFCLYELVQVQKSFLQVF